MPILILEHGRDKAGVVLNGPMVIGRASGLDLVIKAEGMSRIHAKIDSEDGRYFVRDMGSRNGILINQQRIDDKVFLRHGNVVRMGMATFSYDDADELPQSVIPIDLHNKKLKDPLIVFKCGECSAILKAKKSKCGSNGRCITCHSRLQIPEHTGDIAAIAAKKSAPAIAEPEPQVEEETLEQQPVETQAIATEIDEPVETDSTLEAEDDLVFEEESNEDKAVETEAEPVVEDEYRIDDAEPKAPDATSNSSEQTQIDDDDIWMPDVADSAAGLTFADEELDVQSQPETTRDLDADEAFIDLYDVETDDLPDLTDDQPAEPQAPGVFHEKAIEHSAADDSAGDVELEPEAAEPETSVSMLDPVEEPVAETNDEVAEFIDDDADGAVIFDEDEADGFSDESEQTLVETTYVAPTDDVADDETAEAFTFDDAEQAVHDEEDADVAATDVESSLVDDQVAEDAVDIASDLDVDFEDDTEVQVEAEAEADIESDVLVTEEAEPADEQMIEWLEDTTDDSADIVITSSSDVQEQTAVGLCAVCQSMVMQSEAMHHCNSCDTHYHEECWEENFGCATYGCSEVGVLKPAEPVAEATVAGTPPAGKQSAKGKSRGDDGTPWEKVAVGASLFAGVASLFTLGIPSGLVLLGLLGYLIKKRKRKVSKVAVLATFVLCAAGIGGGILVTQMLMQLGWIGIGGQS